MRIEDLRARLEARVVRLKQERNRFMGIPIALDARILEIETILDIIRTEMPRPTAGSLESPFTDRGTHER